MIQRDSCAQRATYYLKSVISCVRPKDAASELTQRFTDSKALQAEWWMHFMDDPTMKFKSVSATSIKVWMNQKFGTFKFGNGIRVTSMKHAVMLWPLGRLLRPQ